ncbi:transmembrane protein [Plakobranchus ocellatus]|uniref:Transmembrane protein n=1 Tax=Plakobranchus ocellatus TaxID=259542 RepID=A0AAV3YT37_9GAST|nr:transmembrane protein [Plakobranchus ocellatus]
MKDSDTVKRSTVARDLCQIFSVFFALAVRVVLGVFSLLTVFVVVNKRNDQRFWALSALLVFLLGEAVYTVVTRNGQERKWVCFCFVCYLLATLPSIWLLELQRLGLFESKLADTNTTDVSSSLPGGLTTNFQLDSDEVIFIVENCMVFLLILCRWFLPRGDITRDQLSQLLFVFIGMASDVMELLQLFDEDKVKSDRTLSYIVLIVWSVSLCQFTLVLTMSASPEKPRVAMNHDSIAESESTPVPTVKGQKAKLDEGRRRLQTKLQRRRSLKEYLLQTEIWSLIVSISMQDGPFLAVRLYIVIELGIIDSTTVFFVLKNIIVILLLAYRLIVVGLLMAENNEDDDDSVDTNHKDNLVSTGIAAEKRTRTNPTLRRRSKSYNASSKQGDLRLSGPPSGQGASGGAQTPIRRVPVDLMAGSLFTVPLTPPGDYDDDDDDKKRDKKEDE